MLSSENNRTCSPLDQITLTVVIDTEEEFDWAAPFNRNSRSVENIHQQHLAQNIFKKYGIIPTYVIDYAVVEDDKAVAVLKDWADKGECLIGTHLHPWVSPPYEEEVNRVNSYAGNLPYEMEKSKLALLTDFIEKKFGSRPVIFKAGRYGVGANTGKILAELGYLVDSSILPHTDTSHDHGPDFSAFGPEPYFFENEGKKLLELPNSRGFCGLLARWGGSIFPLIAGQSGWRSLMAGVLVKSGLLERIPLTPDGIAAKDHLRVVKSMVGTGLNYFNYAYHSSSLMIGGSPYVNNQADLEEFLHNMDDFFEGYFNQIGGCHKTPLELYSLLEKSTVRG